MKKFTHSTAIAMLSVLVLTPILSHAQVEVGTETNGFLNATTDLVATKTEATVDVDANVEVGNKATTSTNDEGSTTTETDNSTQLRLNTEGVAVTSSSQVNNSNDLEVFTDNLVSLDDQVQDIQIQTISSTKSKVEVTYKHKGLLFGIVPVTLKSKTVVESGDGELEVDSKLSWWGFLVINKNRIEDEITTRVRDNATIMMSTEYQASASAQAEIAEAIVTELDSYSSLQINNG